MIDLLNVECQKRALPAVRVFVCRVVCVTLVALLAAAGLAGQRLSDLPRADTVVKPRAYVSLEPVPRGRAFEIAVVAEIIPGFHINANKVLDDYLIPTALKVEPPKGLRVTETNYPPGTLQKFDFSEKMLNVYEGTVTLRMKLEAAADSPLGAVSLPITLRYQACNDKACLPPVRLNVPVEFQIAEAGAKAKAAHAEVFQRVPPKK
jgi:hypothetical protein